MVSVCTVPARGGRLCEHFSGYKTINRIPLGDTNLLCVAALPDLLMTIGLSWSIGPPTDPVHGLK